MERGKGNLETAHLPVILILTGFELTDEKTAITLNQVFRDENIRKVFKLTGKSDLISSQRYGTTFTNVHEEIDDLHIFI